MEFWDKIHQRFSIFHQKMLKIEKKSEYENQLQLQLATLKWNKIKSKVKIE